MILQVPTSLSDRLADRLDPVLRIGPKQTSLDGTAVHANAVL